MKHTIDALLFDMDGTLIDSAPDLLAAINHVRGGLGLRPRDFAQQRHIVSQGADHMMAVGLGDVEQYDSEAARQAFLTYYADHYWVASRPFAGVDTVLAGLADAGVPWAVVTNKSERFASKVLERAGWTGQPGAVICGDTLPVAKPDPAPVLAACTQLGIPPERAIMIGDDERDIQAGQRAGTLTAFARWGYAPPEADGYGADTLLDRPERILSLL